MAKKKRKSRKKVKRKVKVKDMIDNGEDKDHTSEASPQPQGQEILVENIKDVPNDQEGINTSQDQNKGQQIPPEKQVEIVRRIYGVFDGMITATVNNTVLKESKPLTQAEVSQVKMGENICVVLDHYFEKLPWDHPAWLIIGSGYSLATIISKNRGLDKHGNPKPKPKTQDTPSKETAPQSGKVPKPMGKGTSPESDDSPSINPYLLKSGQRSTPD